MKLIVIALTGVLLLGFTSCGSDDPVQSIKDKLSETAQAIQMQERWEGSCANSELLNTSIKRKWDFSSDEFTETLEIYNDENCTESIGLAQLKGDYSLGNIENGGEKTNIDLTYKSLVVTPNNDIAVDIFEAVNLCGVEDWAVGQGKEVSSANGEECFLASFPESKFGVVEVDDSEDTLYLSGDFSDKEETRPRK